MRTDFFVRSAADVHEVRSFLEENGSSMRIIAKIEVQKAVQHFDEILDASDITEILVHVINARASDDPGKKRRRARRALEEAEANVAALEARVASLTAVLEDPALYTRPGGVSEASRLGAELEKVQQKLALALETWSNASEAVERLN